MLKKILSLFFLLFICFFTKTVFANDILKIDNISVFQKSFLYVSNSEVEFFKYVNSDIYNFKFNDLVFIDKDWLNVHLFSNINKSYFDIFSNKNKKIQFYLNYIWSNNSKEIYYNYKNNISCKMLQNKIWTLDNNSINVIDKLNIYFTLNNNLIKRYIWCVIYLYPEIYILNSEINTDYADFRYNNVKIWLSSLHKKEWKFWEELSVYNSVIQKTWYVDWFALFFNNKKNIVESLPVEWWWLCWVSTLLYQNTIKWWYFNITERWSHMNFYNNYYNQLWIDATIFWYWDKASKDFRVVNNHWHILIDTYIIKNKNKLKYGINLISFKSFLNNYIIETSSIYQKWKKKCVNNILKNTNNIIIKKIESCYIDII